MAPLVHRLLVLSAALRRLPLASFPTATTLKYFTSQLLLRRFLFSRMLFFRYTYTGPCFYTSITCDTQHSDLVYFFYLALYIITFSYVV